MMARPSVVDTRHRHLFRPLFSKTTSKTVNLYGIPIATASYGLWCWCLGRLRRNLKRERERGSGELFHRGPFLGKAPLDELPLALRQFGREQPAVAHDVVAVRPQESKLL